MSAIENFPISKILVSLWRPSIPLANPSKLASKGLQDSCTKCFHFLIRLAWESRYRLPIMYALFSFLFDIQMRLEINIHHERRLMLADEEGEDEERDFDSESEVDESETSEISNDLDEGTDASLME